MGRFINDSCAKCGQKLTYEQQSGWYRECGCMLCRRCAPSEDVIPDQDGFGPEEPEYACYFCELVGILAAGGTRAEIDEYAAKFSHATTQHDPKLVQS